MPRRDSASRWRCRVSSARRVGRGDALVEPGTFAPSYRLDVVLAEVEPIAAGAHVTVHHGTAESPARVVRSGDRWAQLRLAPGRRRPRRPVVLRSQTTLGGGVVLDPAPPRHADPDRFERLERGDVAATVFAPVPAASLRRLGDGALAGLSSAGEWVFAPAWLDELRADLDRRLDEADPLDPGIEPPAAPWARDVVPLLGLERRGSRLYRPGAAASLGERSGEAEALARALDEAAPATLKVEDRELARHLEATGRLVAARRRARGRPRGLRPGGGDCPHGVRGGRAHRACPLSRPRRGRPP